MEEDVKSVTLIEGAPLKMLLMCTVQCTFIKTYSLSGLNNSPACTVYTSNMCRRAYILIYS